MKEWDEQDESDADDNDILDEEQLNDLMAVNDDELKMYQQIDQSREERRQQNWTQQHVTRGVHPEDIPALPPNLMSDGEIPAWLSNSGSAPLQLDESDTAVVATTDVLQQPDQLSMDQEDSNLSYSSRKRKEINYSDEPPEFEELDREISQNHGSEEKPRKIKFVMSSNTSEDQFQSFAQIIKGIRALKDDLGRPVYKMFAEKPSRQMFPDYYQVRTNISLWKIVSHKKNSTCVCDCFVANICVVFVVPPISAHRKTHRLEGHQSESPRAQIF